MRPGSNSTVVRAAVLPTTNRWSRPSPDTFNSRRRLDRSPCRLMMSVLPSVKTSRVNRCMSVARAPTTDGPRPGSRRAHLSSAAGGDQVRAGRVVVIVFLTLGLAGAAGAAPRVAEGGGDDRARLAAGCDELLRAAVKTPYGWGWKSYERAAQPDDPRAAPPRPAVSRRGSQPPQAATIDVRSTAAAGLVLHLAGRQLGDARYTHAALQAARAVAAVQMNTGQVPATGVVRANAGGRDEPAAVPSRAATCAGLSLLLTLVHDDQADEADAGSDAADALAREGGPIHRAAVKAANWLAGQQTRSGGWLVAYPPDAAPGDATRLVRLDTPEYRDATIAL